MTRRKKDEGGRPPDSLPTQQDEADILEESGAEQDEDGQFVVDEDKIRELGAVDAESVRANRRSQDYVNKKRGHVKDIRFTTDDLLEKYETIIKSWPPSTLDITATKRTGTPTKYTITSRPRSGVELYEALRVVHGSQEEAEYEVKFFDTNGKQYRGNGRITMPDARPLAQQGQPVQSQPHYQAPPQQPVAPAQAFDPIAMMGQMFEMFQRMQASANPSQPPSLPPVMPPPMLSPQSSPAEQMEWMQRAFGILQQMQTSQARVAAPPPPPPPPQPLPPPSPQSNLTETMAMMQQMFKMFQQMQTSAGGDDQRSGPPYRGGGPFSRGPSRPGYYPQGSEPHYAPPPPPPPSPAQKTPAELFREALGVIRVASDMVQEANSMFPGQQSEGPAPQEDADSPITIMDTGAGKLAFGRDDGGLRLMESGFANLGDILKWGGEQIQKINKANAERHQPPPQQQLPPGFVEVHPGYQPPPGYVMVPVDPRQVPEADPLPSPPANTPPPIQTSWKMPTIPEEEG